MKFRIKELKKFSFSLSSKIPVKSLAKIEQINKAQQLIEDQKMFIEIEAGYNTNINRGQNLTSKIPKSKTYYFKSSEIQKKLELENYQQYYNLSEQSIRTLENYLTLYSVNRDYSKFLTEDYVENNQIFSPDIDIHLVCHSHQDLGWLKTYSQYQFGNYSFLFLFYILTLNHF